MRLGFRWLLLLLPALAIGAQGRTQRAQYSQSNPGYDGRFTFTRIQYGGYSFRRGGGSWAHDWPAADQNMHRILDFLTLVRTNPNGTNVFTLDDPAIFRYPLIYISEPGFWGATDADLANLRTYLLKGGFLWVDDFWGTSAWEHWSSEIRRALPEFPITDVPLDHPIRHTMFEVMHVPQVTNIQFWRRTGGETRERGADSPDANFRMIADEKGRVIKKDDHRMDCTRYLVNSGLAVARPLVPPKPKPDPMMRRAFAGGGTWMG